MVRVEIDRTKWSRGPQSGNALLVGIEASRPIPGNPSRPPVEGTKCCLGFVCTALGVKDEYLLDKWMPDDTYLTLQGLTAVDDVGDIKNTMFAVAASDLNDADLPEDVREAQLIARAAEAGFEFIFIN